MASVTVQERKEHDDGIRALPYCLFIGSEDTESEAEPGSNLEEQRP